MTPAKRIRASSTVSQSVAVPLTTPSFRHNFQQQRDNYTLLFITSVFVYFLSDYLYLLK